MLTLNISATAHGLNYLPQYYADHLGLFADRGLAVTATAKDPWTGVLDDLDSGAADVALGGLWVPAMYCEHAPQALRLRSGQPPVPQGPGDPDAPPGLRLVRPGREDRARTGHRRQRAVRVHRGPRSGSPASTRRRSRCCATCRRRCTSNCSRPASATPSCWTTANAEAMQHRGTGVHRQRLHRRPAGSVPTACTTAAPTGSRNCPTGWCASPQRSQESMQLMKSVNVAELRPLLDEHWPTMPQEVLGSACGRMLHSQTWDTRAHRPASHRAVDANPVRREHGSQRARLRRRGRHHDRRRRSTSAAVSV